MKDENPKPMRMKIFAECTDKEKINFLAFELKRTQQKLSKVCSALSVLWEHEHLGNRLVAKVRYPNEESYSGFYFKTNDEL